MNPVSQYFKGLFQGIGALLQGMSVTWKELFAKKVTQQYPENRKTLVMSDRFRGELEMPHDQNNEHACTSCGICEMNCPNGTIQITSKNIETAEGRKKKILDVYIYNLDMCTFCNLCVLTCPSDAIRFTGKFENALFTRDKLKMQLNHEGSKLREKKKPEPKVAETPAANAVKAESATEKKVVEPADISVKTDEQKETLSDSTSGIDKVVDNSMVKNLTSKPAESNELPVSDKIENVDVPKPNLSDDNKNNSQGRSKSNRI